MVPAFELPQHKSTRSVPTASGAMEYPSWTRDDDNEEDPRRAGLRRDSDRSRGRFSQIRALSWPVSENEKRDQDSSSDSDRESGTATKDAPPRQLGQGPDSADTPSSPALPPDTTPAPSVAAQRQRPWSLRISSRPSMIKVDVKPAATAVPTPETQNGDILRPVYNAEYKPADDIRPVSPKSPKSPKTPIIPMGPKTPEFEQPAATAPQPVLPPPPIITTRPIPELLDGARKELGPPPRTEVPVVTVTESRPPTGASALPDRLGAERPEPTREDYHEMHGNLHSRTEDALIAVGSVGATIIAFFVFWLAWRCLKSQKRKRIAGLSGEEPLTESSLNRPKQLVVGLASRIPILKERIAKRKWANLDKPYDEAYWDKTFPASNEAPQGGGKGIRVHTAIFTRSDPESQLDLTLPVQMPQQPAASQQAPYKTDTRSRHQMSRISDISSLSSGFGDGDIVMPPVHGTATVIAAESLAMPAPVAQRNSVSEASQRRETVYTEASEDPLPRFRTINSWVRQQSGRVKRANQRDLAASDAPPVPSMPPEQDFRLMMPDGEEPRRAEEAG